MDRTPPHIPRILLHKRPLPSLMHHTRIIPHNQVTLVLPLNAKHIFLLTGVREQLLNQLVAFGFGDAFFLGTGILQVVDVVGDVEVSSAAGFVDLEDLVPAEGEVFWIGFL